MVVTISEDTSVKKLVNLCDDVPLTGCGPSPGRRATSIPQPVEPTDTSAASPPRTAQRPTILPSPGPFLRGAAVDLAAAVDTARPQEKPHGMDLNGKAVLRRPRRRELALRRGG
jgi:hypothetical protein